MLKSLVRVWTRSCRERPGAGGSSRRRSLPAGRSARAGQTTQLGCVRSPPCLDTQQGCVSRGEGRSPRDSEEWFCFTLVLYTEI